MTGIGFGNSGASTDTIEKTVVEVDETVPHVVIVWDDDVNTMNYVAAVFVKHFKLDVDTAIKKMLEVHNNGKSILDSGSKTDMEFHALVLDVQYGLTTTVEKA